MSTCTISRSRLSRKVKIDGAKNSALRLLAASILTDEDLYLENYPASILDAQLHVQMLEALGKNCIVNEDSISITETETLHNQLIWNERSIRNTLLILGALTTRFGHGAVPLPGGCQLGDRKFDLHLMLLEAMGAEVSESNGNLIAEAPKGLHGAEIHLPIRSTGATENAILCATLARGTTRIWNPHIRPEILDLIAMLSRMGAKIEVRGQESILIEGVEGLRGTTHRVIPDNIEAITWLIGAAITGGDVEIVDFPFEHLEIPLIHLRESGVEVFRCDNKAIVRGKNIYPVDISTGPYPGINSDMQPLFAVLGAVAQGESRIVDLRFPGRYAYAQELAKMGVEHEVKDNLLRIKGGKHLQGAKVKALDLRAGAALMLAGMVADGETVIEDAWQIQRGYSNIESKLKKLGASVSL
jgi:UDP-N-acetylglucosamine 1-carboxyvinyltransferase